MDGYSISKTKRQQKAFAQRITLNGLTYDEAVQARLEADAIKNNKLSSYARKLTRNTEESVIAPIEPLQSIIAIEPSKAEVQKMVEVLKAQGLMTEVRSSQEIVADADILAFRNASEKSHAMSFSLSHPTIILSPTQADGWKSPDESKVLVAFDPNQPIFVPSPTQADGWKPARDYETDDIAEEVHEPKIDWLRFIACGIGALVTYAALLKFGAAAGGGTNEAWFWTAMTVVPGSILLALPFRFWQLGSWLQKIMGISLIGISYITMHASIVTMEYQGVSASAAESAEVQQRQARIADLESQLKPIRDAIARLDPIRNRSTITSLRVEAKDLEDKLSHAREALIAAHHSAKAEASAGVTKKWSLVEWLRRLMLEPLNILCLHGLLAEYPMVLALIRKRSSIVQDTYLRSGLRA